MSSLQGDPPATDGGTILSLQHTNQPRLRAETGRRASRGLFPKGMLMVIPIFVLAMATTWYSSKVAGTVVRLGEGGSQSLLPSNGGDEKGSDSNDGGFVRRVRNPPTTDASPLCTEEQRHKIAHQLMLKEDEEVGNTDVLKLKNSKWPRMEFWFRCPKTSWIDNFYAEETDIGSSEFLGISVGCNKGHDAIRTARMGLSDASIDAHKWRDEFHSDVTAVCRASNAPQFNVISSQTQRKGEMHCIEPMPSTFSELQRVDEKFDLTSKGVVFTHAAISSTSGVVKFPNPNANVGVEWLGIKNCKSSADVEKTNCVEVPMFSLEDYVAKYVKGSGPINILQIDVEGNDFDVLFGAGSVLDSTHYLEFEYAWDKNLHIEDAVKLLDGKGFTCYWSGENRLWRISGCYFDHYNFFHVWSNVACVHRSQKKLYDRMEKVFTDLLEEW